MGKDRETRLGLRMMRLGAARQRCGSPARHSIRTGGITITSVCAALGDAVVVRGVGHPSEPVSNLKPNVRPADVTRGGCEGDAAHRVPARLSVTISAEIADVLEDDGIAVERIAGAVKAAAVAKPPSVIARSSR
jgi:hypothetical protein